MGRFVKGDVVVIPFPFSDLSKSKRRPALVLAGLKGADVILCQITSENVRDEYAIPLRRKDFQEGTINRDSNIRPNRLFTADEGIITYKAGSVKKSALDQAIEKTIALLTGSM